LLVLEHVGDGGQSGPDQQPGVHAVAGQSRCGYEKLVPEEGGLGVDQGPEGVSCQLAAGSGYAGVDVDLIRFAAAAGSADGGQATGRERVES
jgi:hypothetical protein